MNEIAKALIKAFISLLHPRMLLLMIWPVVVALLMWLGLAVVYWSQVAAWIELQIRTAPVIETVITWWPFALIAAHLAWILLVLLFIPLVLITAVLIIGIFAMPMMVNHVVGRDYPGLARNTGGSFIGGVWNGIAALLWLAVLTLLTLPLWLLLPLWPMIPVLLFGYFNQRVFRYDALAEHASAHEMRTVIKRHGGKLLVMGMLMSLMSYVPLLGFFAPVFAGLAFIHFCLERLAELRSEPIEGVAVRV